MLTRVPSSVPPAMGRPATVRRRVAPTSCGHIVGLFGTVAAVAIAAAHVLGAAVVHPVHDPVSFYAFVPAGGELVLLGSTAMAVLGLALVARATRSGLAPGAVSVAAMVVFALAMVLLGLFPTDPPGAPTSISAVVHRVSAATAFVVLPVAGRGVLRAVPAPTSRYPRHVARLGAVFGAAVVLFLAVHLPLAATGSGIAAFGLLERVGLVLMIAYLFLLAATIDHEGASEQTPPGPLADIDPAARTSHDTVTAPPAVPAV